MNDVTCEIFCHEIETMEDKCQLHRFELSIFSSEDRITFSASGTISQ